MTEPSSPAAMIAFLKFACTAASWLASIRVPICTPSAPRTTAAVADRASQIPPAAMIGRSTRLATRGSNTNVDASRAALNPPPSTPSTTSASTPASTAFMAPFSDPTTCTTVMPASCSRAVNNAGSPAEVNTCRTSAATSSSMMDGSRFQPWIIRLAATGRSVSSRTLCRSARPSAVNVSIMPRPPPSETAAASSALAM
jgi:hypothetical protein